MTAATIQGPGDVGGYVAWQALVLDGVLVPLSTGLARPAAVHETTLLRAEALGRIVPPGLAVARQTALWVYCGGPPVASPEVYYRSHSHRPRGRCDLVVRQATLLTRDLTRVGAVTVTSPERTALDLARFLPHEVAVAALVKLTAHTGPVLDGAHGLLRARMRWAGRTRALAVLDAVADAVAEGAPYAGS